jgi:hypothetical protein
MPAKLEFGGYPLTSFLSLLNRKQGSLAFPVKNLVLCPFALELRARFFVKKAIAFCVPQNDKGGACSSQTTSD